MPNVYIGLVGVIFLIGGLVDKKGEFSLSLIIGSCIIFHLIILGIDHFNRRRKFFKLIYHYAELYEQKQLGRTYIISDTGFTYQDNEKSFQLNWHLIQKPIIFKDHFIIVVRNGTLNFIISKTEAGEKTYQEIITIANEKTTE